jgi:hypothetical protein
MMARPRLQVAYLWRGQVLGYRLLGPGETLTVGSGKGVTFATPMLTGFPKRFRLLRSVRDGFRLQLGPGMSGDLVLRGQPRTVADVLAGPAVRKLLRDPGMFRETEIYPGDTATITLPGEGSVKLKLTFTEAPETIGRPLNKDPLFAQILFGTAVSLIMVFACALVFGKRVCEQYDVNGECVFPVALTAETVAKMAQVIESPKVKDDLAKSKAAAADRERKRREAAEAKRAKEAQGKLGRNDATKKETVMPKGQHDVIREKVAKTGILAALGNQRPDGSGLGRLLNPTNSNEMEQALTGLQGAKLAVGKGSNGLGLVGSGPGGGGTGFGHIAGTGNVDVGAGSGRGRRGSGPGGLGGGKEREVKVAVETGTADAEGGLSREQVDRVVRAHRAAISYCYEKELQRQPSLSGKVDIFWVIRANGTVDRTKIASSTVGSTAVEGCIERQVKNWQFPRSDGETIVRKYPFFFKGSS